MPQAVRDQQIFGELGQLDAIFTNPRGVMLSGRDTDRNAVRAAFAEDGTLLRFGRGDDRDRGMHGMGGPRGDRGPGKHDGKHDGKGDRGDDHMGRKDRDHGKRGRHHDGDRGSDRDRGDRGADRGPGAGAVGGDPLSPDQIRASLTGAGYTAVGQILQQGSITVAQATNPEGEAVLVELGLDGRVLRELNR